MTSATAHPDALPRPPELDRLDPRRHAVIEASAGTGKTYLLEHLVLELIIGGHAAIDEILIVTFTEKATAELKQRIARKLDEALAVGNRARLSSAASAAADTPTTSAIASETGSTWKIDAEARDRLRAARAALDGAPISTIHAFCQRILTDEGFAIRRLIGQQRIDGRTLFSDAFREVLRRQLAVEPQHRPYLDAYLLTGRTVERLDDLLFQAHRLGIGGATWARHFEEPPLTDLLEKVVALDVDAPGFELAIKRALREASKTNRADTIPRKLRAVQEIARPCLVERNWPKFLAQLDAIADDIFKYVEVAEEISAHNADVPALAALHEIATGLLDLAPPLDEAVAQRFAPLVAREAQHRKLAEGLYDFDDMVTAVAEAVESESIGDELTAVLRRRYRYALVDECQDTDPAQWRIFRRVFLDSDGRNPLTLIGDPKQAIYAFRGAEVGTFLAARREIEARGGVMLALDRNFRSTPEVVAAYNAILDQSAAPPFFTSADIRYDHPVRSERDRDPSASVTLLRVELPATATASPPAPLRVGVVNQAVGRAIADEIARLVRDADLGPEGALSDIFVLTRKTAEAVDIAGYIRAAGVPASLYKQDGLFRAPEVDHVRALIAALARPDDRAARLQVWLTPFFDVSLSALANAPEPGADHPLCQRLANWRALAEARAYESLWSRILDESGVARRLRFVPSGKRRLTNYRHLFDLLLAETARWRPPVEELDARLAALAAGHRLPAGDDADVQRLETDSPAVQVMTLHKAKGLEADTVFLYGGLTRFGRRAAVETLRDPVNGGRLLRAGKPRRPTTIDELRAIAAEEDQRLLYVGLTRARRRLYLPFFPETEASDSDGAEENTLDLFKQLAGCYRHVNRRLRAVATEPELASLFGVAPIPCPAPRSPGLPEVESAIEAWMPPEPEFVAKPAVPPFATPGATGDTDAAWTELRFSRRGFPITSYTRLKEAEGGYHPAVDSTTDESPEVADAGIDDVSATAIGESPDDLPGGAATGLLLHALLEKIALDPDLFHGDEWHQRPEVVRLFERELARWNGDVASLPPLARMVRNAVTADLPLGAGVLRGLTRASKVRREVDFLFPVCQPLPAASLPAASLPATEGRLRYADGFVRGVIDVIFEHEGRVFFADWKSDVLPSYASERVLAHVESNYALQIRLYALAILAMLGIRLNADAPSVDIRASADAYERRFGGFAYVFLRGLPRGGIYVGRPSFAEVCGWHRDLVGSAARSTVPGAAPARTDRHSGAQR